MAITTTEHCYQCNGTGRLTAYGSYGQKTAQDVCLKCSGKGIITKVVKNKPSQNRNSGGSSGGSCLLVMLILVFSFGGIFSAFSQINIRNNGVEWEWMRLDKKEEDNHSSGITFLN